MTQEDVLIEEVNLDNKIDKRKNSIAFWINYLKKSWSIYIIVVGFTIFFVVLYFISSGLAFPFYASIFYPILMLIYFLAEGTYKNIKYVKALEKNLKTLLISIYTTRIVFKNNVNGMNYVQEYPYESLNRIYYKANKEEIRFEAKKKDYFSLEKSDIKEETFEFLSTLFSQEKE
ncbi:MAG: hypothetical protein K2K48_04985 [Anaeroplasmataceae bacterium]|nr:hypothetical protein [Anaeroplasmataceae bacterium]